MLSLYNKIDKYELDTTGYQQFPDVSILERPFLLCISPYENYPRAVFGTIRAGAQAARVLTTQEIAAGFIANSFPIDIIGFGFQRDNNYYQRSVEVADKVLYPYLTKNGLQKNALKKQARKMNIFAYDDDGVNTYKDAEKRLLILLKRDKIENDDIIEILSSISLVALDGIVDTGDIYATSCSFIDVNDTTTNEALSKYKQFLDDRGLELMYASLGDTNNVLYIYSGTGAHDLKKFFSDDCVAKPAVSAVVSYFLENSLRKRFRAISVEDIVKELDEYGSGEKPVVEALADLDKSLSYGDAEKFSLESAKIRMELDKVYKTLQKTNTVLIRTLKEKKCQEVKINRVIEGIRNYSSDITYKQILSSAKMLKVKDDSDVLISMSDKDYRNN